MDDLTDQIKAWTDATAAHNEVEAVRAEDIMGDVRVRADHHGGGWRRVAGFVAAAVVVVAAIGVAIGVAANRDQTVVSTGPGNRMTKPGPGSPIVAGLTVQPGSVLLGTTFPDDRFGTEGDQTWSALLQVTGNPAAVFDAYVHRLGELGIAIRVSCGDGSATLGLSPAQTSFSCEGSGTSSDPGSDIVSADLELASPARDTNSYPTSLAVHVRMRDPNAPPTTLSQLGRYFRSIPTTTMAPTTLSSSARKLVASAGPATLPSTGELIAPAWMDPGVRLRLVEGSPLLQVATPLDTGTQGWVTVAQVTGDPSEVLHAYLDQDPQSTVHSSETTLDGRRVLWGSWDSAGGPKLFLTAVQVAGGEWFLRINVMND